ncbi:PREDICTED: U-box domain-containing protein 33-like isoform X2 [Nelumbo nucifera]|uniref:RING-type E3 ubiquitin transferase n=2 Tax=Nelumbo nucifera TaxID=4432 RepID=A0A1U7ZHA7_NELNU|nr:PREDICTED: U-box domain-containing protein 33-like isoform X1 [Nelumbo nucifera]XP_010253187.1 PREDICTED: U-box domain-containing protein 33-like isoform X2 [Nelumbo nucifera]DAD25848.1 TPA_asm: hypothetical protein HUJ06_027316 [Nelumbo nucifera]
MELLEPSPPEPSGDDSIQLFDSPTFPLAFHLGLRGPHIVPLSPEIAVDGADIVHVAVGNSIEKTIALLYWTFRRFKNLYICLLHIHQPSPTIPTLLGKLPANQANQETVSAYRKEEMERTKKLLFNYLGICHRAKVKASIIAIESGQVQKGILDLVNMRSIKKLVMGTASDNCMKVKNSTKANYVAKNAPAFCQVWFVNKGKHVWTRESSESPNVLPPENVHAERLRSSLPHNHKPEIIFNPECFRSTSIPGRVSNGVSSCNQLEQDETEETLSTSGSCSLDRFDLIGTISGHASSTERRVSSESDLNLEKERLYNQLEEARREVEASKNEACVELLRSKKLELEAIEAINKVKDFEASFLHEVELRKEVEEALRTTRQEQRNLLETREEVIRDLQKTMRNVAILDIQTHEAMRRRDEATGELRLIQASIETLRHEGQRIQQQKEEALCQLKRWRSCSQHGATKGKGLDGFVNHLPMFTEFSRLDLQTATCNFSESFKIGQGGYGCVYKGEIFDRSIAIKKLHPHNVQSISEFQQEVVVLSKLQHPHLVTLIGACPEAWSLVHEYLPNGNLQDHLFFRRNNPPLTWKTRMRIAARVSSALLFLHTYRPEKMIHGDLKPENILLDSEFNCKIGDFGICRLVPEETARCPSFRWNTEGKGAFPYMDPEIERTRDLTSKSDIYSFGIIILQLLTGRHPVGLVSEVRQAVSYGKLASILDPSAGEWPTFVARQLVDHGLKFCELNSRDRPELTPAIVRDLEQLHLAEERPVPSFFLCPILQEIMHDPQVAADGFTYEGEALRGWLANGRETSPMTNLKLSHLHLTPNHALRHAIQHWLCQY